MERSRVLLIFYRNPEEGKVKTRLAATVGDATALKIYQHLTEHTKSETMQLACDKIVFYSDRIDHADLWTSAEFVKQQQIGDDLGKRMQHAFEFAFAAGYQQVCVIGTDCLELKAQIVEEAFQKLKSADVVIGPARDGGYYLLGLKQMVTDLFINKRWSSDSVFQDTVEDLKRNQLSFYELGVLNDVDTESDLPENWRSRIF